ncbi:hypothetical protein C8F01DRAFT_1137606 [Mycena amicta]|nr:hypothetical protein C8F01DRAFT_1137606 [Mycena amicta]
MHFTALVSFLVVAAGFVRAADDRLLYKIPAGDTIDQFTSDFNTACSTWQPAIDQGLTFVEALVEPGDFSGKNADTEAKIVCAWENSNDVITTFTEDVATSLGATPA